MTQPKLLKGISPAIENLRATRNLLKENEDKYGKEMELLYQLTSLTMEIDQYLSGGYLSVEFTDEKCDTIKRICQGIHKEVFG